MNKTSILIAVSILVIVGALGVVQFLSKKQPIPAESPVATSTPEQNVSTTTEVVVKTTVTTTKRPVANPLPISSGDTVISWSFAGAYANNVDLIAKANTEIRRVSGLLGSGQYSDTALYIGIANQYDLLGDGKQEYDYLIRAVKADVNVTSGLPWHNLGVLMEKLGAIQTARTAYEKSTLIQPGSKFYHYAYLEFLINRLKGETSIIEKAFSTAIKSLGQDSDIIQLQTEWKNS